MRFRTGPKEMAAMQGRRYSCERGHWHLTKRDAEDCERRAWMRAAVTPKDWQGVPAALEGKQLDLFGGLKK